MSHWCDCRAAMILFGVALLLPSPIFAQYASEWHEWHGQEWNGAPGWLSLPQPAFGYYYGSSYPAGTHYYPVPSYGYPYDPPPYHYGYSAGFSEGFTAGYDHGFSGGLNEAYATDYAARLYGGYYGRRAYGYPYAYHGY